MKKFLSAFLALVMILSCFASITLVSAEEDAWYWRWGKNTELKEGYVVSAEHFTGDKSPASILNSFKGTADMAVDATGADYFAFDLYVSNAAAFKDVNVELELSSNLGGGDKYEARYVSQSLNDKVVGEWKDGWNTIQIPLSIMTNGDDSKATEIDWSSVVWFRMYNLGAVSAGESFDIAYDNLRFIKGEETIQFSPIVKDPNAVEKQSVSFLPENPIALYNILAPNNGCSQEVTVPFNTITEYKLLMNIIDNKGTAVLSVGTEPGSAAYGSLTLDLTTLEKGQQFVTFTFAEALSVPANSKVYFSIQTYDSGTIHVLGQAGGGATGSYNYDVPNYGGYKAEAHSQSYEVIGYQDAVTTVTTKYTNIVYQISSDTSDGGYLDEITANVGYVDWCRFADKTGYFTHKFNIDVEQPITELTWTAKVGGDLHLLASADGETWVDINTAAIEGVQTFDLAAIVADVNTTKTAYIKIADNTTEGGGGGQVHTGHDVVLAIGYEVEVETPDEPETPAITEIAVPGYAGKANYPTNWSLWTDSGKTAMSKTFAANGTQGAASVLCQTGKIETPIDASAADAFVFDYYVSNAAAVKDIKVELELCSGGTCDSGEDRYLNKTLGAVAVDGLKDGWNTISIPLTEFIDHDGADFTKINYFRCYNLDPITVGDAELRIAYANLRFAAAGETVASFPELKAETNNWTAMNAVKIDGKYAMGKTFSGEIKGAGSVMVMYGNKGTATPADITGMKYLEFDMYVNNPDAVANVDWCIEITSSGTCDKEENQVITKLALNAGWNHIAIEIPAGGLDYSRFNFIRIFSVSDFNAGEDTTIAFTNFVFTLTTTPNLDMDHPEGNLVAEGAPVVDGKLDDLYAGSSAYTLSNDEYSVTFYLAVDGDYIYIAEVRKDNSPNWPTNFKEPYFGDGSLLWFDALAAGIQWNRKLADGTNPVLGLFFDDNQTASTQKDWETAVVDFNGGYVMEAKIPLADLLLEKADFVDGVRFTFCVVDVNANGDRNQLNAAGVSDYNNAPTVQFKSEGGEGGEVEPPVEEELTHKTYVYQVGSDNTLPNDGGYLYEVAAQHVGHNGDCRFADATGYFTYKFDINLIEAIETLTWTAKLAGNQMHLMASADNKNWVDLHKGQISGVQTIDLAELIDAVNASKTLYIKVADSDTSDGQGGQVLTGYDITLDIGYKAMSAEEKDAAEATATPGVTPLFGCNISFQAGGGFALDNENAVAGSGCLSATFKQDSATQVSQIVLDAVDATGADSLVFELYISDAAILDESWGGQIEITSSGKCDVNELAIEMKDLRPLLKEQGVKAGWNTVYIPLAKMVTTGGDIDLSAVNFFRWYRTTGNLTGEYTVKIDNIRLVAVEKLSESVATEHSKPIFGCETSWGGMWTVDNENAVGGFGCLSLEYKKGQGNSVSSNPLADAPVDGTGMDTLEFEIYFSDIAIIDKIIAAGKDGQFELSSSGTCDQKELSITMVNLFKFIKEQDPQAGWNHIALPLSKMSEQDGWDISNINHLRVYQLSVGDIVAEDESFTIKLDNIRLTDAQAQIKAEEEAKKAEFAEKNAALIADLEALSAYATVDAANYEAAKAAIEAAQAKVDALKGDDAEYIKDYTSALKKATKALEDYEEDKAGADQAKADAIAANQELYDAIKALTSDITDENYESVKAAVEAALTGWDALDDTVKAYFEEDGLKTTLDAAKAAVDAFTPSSAAGCKSALAIGAVAMMVLAGAWVSMVARKKED